MEKKTSKQIKLLSLNKYLRIQILLVIIIFVFLFKKNSFCQNLISNGSFEIYTSPVNCTGGGGGVDNYSVFPVNHVVDYWNTLNSPDYFSQLCNGVNNNGAPLNALGYSQAYQGNNYSGAILFAANYETKEYIYQQLNSPLQAGKMYCLSFYISRADRVTHAVHSIGAYFSNNVQSVAALGYVNATPQIINQSGFVTDTANWVQIQGCYTASGGEQYITIGNFNSNANTDTLFVGSNDPHPGADRYAYYYIDDITLIDQSTVVVNELSNGASVNVYPNPASDVLNISLNTIKENLKIKITDVIGRDVLVSEYKSQLDVSFLEKGIYFVSILQGNKTLGTKKIIKQ